MGWEWIIDLDKLTGEIGEQGVKGEITHVSIENGVHFHTFGKDRDCTFGKTKGIHFVHLCNLIIWWTLHHTLKMVFTFTFEESDGFEMRPENKGDIFCSIVQLNYLMDSSSHIDSIIFITHLAGLNQN